MSDECVWPRTSWDRPQDVTTAGFSPTGLERVAAAARSLATTALMVVAGGRRPPSTRAGESRPTDSQCRNTCAGRPK